MRVFKMMKPNYCGQYSQLKAKFIAILSDAACHPPDVDYDVLFRFSRRPDSIDPKYLIFEKLVRKLEPLQ